MYETYILWVKMFYGAMVCYGARAGLQRVVVYAMSDLWGTGLYDSFPRAISKVLQSFNQLNQCLTLKWLISMVAVFRSSQMLDSSK